ncbi:alpha/beta hydrolase [Streptomyces sp. TS71-3]|uniref:alpha/beta hydrolase n=1 Tax=Streptomyces sp. TS71-3 TaxID=2733862 RepID=UPI001B0AF110|nr:alpha/beta hydrolase [Streptomyces sp. TS71-3]GHJ35826.1 peptidase [Streptomyces sp. TS71-3]
MPKPSSPRTATLATAAVLLSASLTACGNSEGAGGESGGRHVPGRQQDNPWKQKLHWRDCPAPSESEGGGPSPSPLPHGGTWQCTAMKAPLAWSDPEGDTIDLALIRAKASGPKDRRLGSLAFNFGGPGGSGVTTLPAFGSDYEKLRTRYDLVSFDPRGVGRSAGVRCENDRQLDAYFQQDFTPENGTEESRLLRNTRAFNTACERNSRRLLPHVGTTNAARDMDLMRHVLGDRKLNYFGISYGTELGGVYAHLFPKRLGRTVFDGVVDPTQTPAQSALGQARGFQLALNNYARNCVAKPGGCPVGDSEQEVEQRMAGLLRSLDTKPLPGIGGRRLTQTAATNGIAQALYSKDFWDYLTEGLEEAYDGNGTVLMMLSDSMNGRNQDGRYSNVQAANVAINCADDRQRYTPAQVQQQLPAFRQASPLFGDYLAWSMLSCTGWPVRGAADRPDVHAPGAPPILVIGNTGDPATPYRGAQRMVQGLGDHVGVELTYKGQGHGAYDSGSKCVRNAVNGYLLDGKMPPAGTVCS